jgi:hypothetical protein
MSDFGRTANAGLGTAFAIQIFVCLIIFIILLIPIVCFITYFICYPFYWAYNQMIKGICEIFNIDYKDCF